MSGSRAAIASGSRPAGVYSPPHDRVLPLDTEIPSWRQLAPTIFGTPATRLAVVGIVAGVLLIGWPLAGTLSLRAVLIAFLFVEGPTCTAATA